jgi:hypothetical protein
MGGFQSREGQDRQIGLSTYDWKPQVTLFGALEGKAVAMRPDRAICIVLLPASVTNLSQWIFL